MASPRDFFAALFLVALDINFKDFYSSEYSSEPKSIFVCHVCCLMWQFHPAWVWEDMDLFECYQYSRKIQSVWVDYPIVVWETEDEHFQKPVFKN